MIVIMQKRNNAMEKTIMDKPQVQLLGTAMGKTQSHIIQIHCLLVRFNSTDIIHIVHTYICTHLYFTIRIKQKQSNNK